MRRKFQMQFKVEIKPQTKVWMQKFRQKSFENKIFLFHSVGIIIQFIGLEKPNDRTIVNSSIRFLWFDFVKIINR